MKAKNFAVFALHATDPAGRKMLDKLDDERPDVSSFALDTTQPEALDTETAAKLILNHALDSKELPELVRPKVGDSESGFRSLGTEMVALTGTKMVKFRQYIKGIPVYGTLVTVEMDKNKQCLALNATVATPNIRDHLAKVSPFTALAKAAECAGYEDDMPERTPILHYFLDRKRRWHLAYIVENVRTNRPRSQDDGETFVPLVYDYVVDAITAEVLISLPRTPSFKAIEERADDDRQETRTFSVQEINGVKRMRDPELNLETYSFGFADPRAERDRLPGKQCVAPRRGKWSPAAVSAHANAATVARFLREVLKRNNIDNKGGTIVSVINCIVQDEADEDGRGWKNGFWDGKQMVYGQTWYKDRYRSFASNLDVVAHELFHGVSSNTARLEYIFETGALNESYSDIFGILISNARTRNIENWEWRLGDGLSEDFDHGTRDFSNPANKKLGKRQQPMFWKDYKHWPVSNDKGGVHFNSGIHNYAAYRVMTAKDGNGGYLFKPRQLAAIFYIALTQHLARQATFWASRAAVVLATRSLFRNLPRAELNRRVRAVEDGFAAAGIE
jgi:Zn-dependent metalloprotease